MLYKKDTIAALATAPLPAGVAVIRVSGESALASVGKLISKNTSLTHSKMKFSRLYNAQGEVLDEALLAYFKAPKSFTGEDVVEIHCHGGKAVVDGILKELMEYNVRLAEAGEFSKRAFMNGKMDLTAAEGIMDLVAAETEAQRKQALNQLQGKLGEQFEVWRSELLHLLAHIEAAIDFPDEELDVIEDAGIQNKLTVLLNNLKGSIQTDAAVRLRSGFELSIIGKPNAGKSSLTNLLTGKDTAIVSDIEGTTRDVVESHLNIKGYPVILSDTAGLRETDDVIEKEGVVRAQKKATLSDVVIVVVDSREWPVVDPVVAGQIVPENTIFILSKTDLLNDGDPCIVNNMVEYNRCKYPAIALNLTNTSYMDDLLELIEERIRAKFVTSQSAALVTRERHKEAIRKTVTYIEKALEIIQSNNHYSISELIAQDLRDAAKGIGEVTGRTDTEDVLDVVFSSFCIGK